MAARRATPELSRRCALAFQVPPLVELPPDERYALAYRIDAAGTWDQLDPDDRQLVEASERNLRRGDPLSIFSPTRHNGPGSGATGRTAQPS